MQEGSGCSPCWEEGILSVSPSLIFLLFTDFDLSGNLKLSLGDFRLEAAVQSGGGTLPPSYLLKARKPTTLV